MFASLLDELVLAVDLCAASGYRGRTKRSSVVSPIWEPSMRGCERASRGLLSYSTGSRRAGLYSRPMSKRASLQEPTDAEPAQRRRTAHALLLAGVMVAGHSDAARIGRVQAEDYQRTYS